MGILFTSKCRVNLLKIKLLAYMHLLFEFSYAERDNTLLFTHLIDYLSSYDFNELLSHCLAAGECAERFPLCYESAYLLSRHCEEKKSDLF